MLAEVNGTAPSPKSCGFLVVAPDDGVLAVYQLVPHELDRADWLMRHGYVVTPRKRIWKWKRKDGARGVSMVLYATSRGDAIAKWFKIRQHIRA